MIKRKQKLQIINEYIKILKLEVLLQSSDKVKLKNVLKIKNQYEKICFKVGLMDEALGLLKKDFNLAQQVSCSNENLNKLESEVEKMSINLPNKLTNLKLNDFEINFILYG